ncbi:hypothetical protein D3C76_882140 [compost metagenome]
MLGNMVTQARDDQDGSGGMQSFHVSTYAQVSLLTTLGERLTVTVITPTPGCFTLNVSDFSFDDTDAGSRPLRLNSGQIAPGEGQETAFHLMTLRL